MKKFIVSILLLLPLGLIAQEVKIAVVNTQDIFNIMPEVSELESETASLAEQYDKEYKIMEDEYNRKFADLTAQGDSLSENIRTLRIQEIQSIQERIETFVPMARAAMEKRQEELMVPIREKIQKAIDEVGEENGYSYILNPGVLLYMGKSSVDATDKVKAKLGLR